MSEGPRNLRMRTTPRDSEAVTMPWALPWHLPLESWRGDRLVEVARGVHRHVVRFLQLGDAVYALKELPRRTAAQEYGILRLLHEEGLPAVKPVAVVERGDHPAAGDQPLDDVLVTRYLDYSLPYRVLFAHAAGEAGEEGLALQTRLLDALAMLLVRLHLAGFFWGDCSLSNTLFRRDAGALAAYVVDVETAERHPRLSDGQRVLDLEIAELNIAGGLLDVQAELGVGGYDAVSLAEDLGRRYERLWRELTSEEVIRPDERHRLEARIRRLNQLGFDVDEIEVVVGGGGDELRLKPVVTEQGHHRRRLRELTGLGAQENQARSLLNDLANFRAAVEHREGRALPEGVAAYRWLMEVFEPTVGAIPAALRGKREPVELFHEVLEHKWYLSERQGGEVGIREAVEDYIAAVLPKRPDERAVITSGSSTAPLADRAGRWLD